MIEEEILNECRERFAAHKATLIQDTDRYMIIDSCPHTRGDDYRQTL